MPPNTKSHKPNRYHALHLWIKSVRISEKNPHSSHIIYKLQSHQHKIIFPQQNHKDIVIMEQKWTIYITTISMTEIPRDYSTFHSLDMFSPCFAFYISLLLLLSEIPHVPYWARKRIVGSWPWLDTRCPQRWSITPCFCRTGARK